MTQNLSSVVNVRASRDTALSLVPSKFGDVFANMDEHISNMTELELETHFDRTPNDYALRKRLWELVDQGQEFTSADWARGICQPSYIVNTVWKNPYRLSWLFIPVQSFKDTYEETFSFLLNKFRQRISDMTINDDNLSAAVKLLEHLSNRVLGPVPKNINMRTQSIPGPQANSPAEPESLDERLKRLESGKIAQTIIAIESSAESDED